MKVWTLMSTDSGLTMVHKPIVINSIDEYDVNLDEKSDFLVVESIDDPLEDGMIKSGLSYYINPHKSPRPLKIKA